MIVVVIEQQIALHYLGGGSDKIWAGAVKSNGEFESVWGRRGAALQRGNKPTGSVPAARKIMDKKVAEKLSEGYCQISFDDPQYGVPSFGEQKPDQQEAAGEGGGGEVSLNLAIGGSRPVKITVYATAHLTPVAWQEVEAVVSAEGMGLSEKVNGERTLVAYAPGSSSVKAYNRKGQETTVPASALALAGLGVQFVIDGERLLAGQVGEYVMFDLLELDGEDLRSHPYSKRIERLEQSLKQANLITAALPVYRQTVAKSQNGLSLLSVAITPPAKKILIAEIQAKDGEGVVIRDLDKPYQAGDTRYIRKYKFLGEIDCVVIGVKPGIGTGSITLGLYRTSDGALIEVGNVRSGLTDTAITQIGQMLDRGERPVIRVEFLPIRTVGIRLVEPKTNLSMLRTDKAADECSTEQLLEFGADKAALIAQAVAVSA